MQTLLERLIQISGCFMRIKTISFRSSCTDWGPWSLVILLLRELILEESVFVNTSSLLANFIEEVFGLWFTQPSSCRTEEAPNTFEASLNDSIVDKFLWISTFFWSSCEVSWRSIVLVVSTGRPARYSAIPRGVTFWREGLLTSMPCCMMERNGNKVKEYYKYANKKGWPLHKAVPQWNCVRGKRLHTTA